MTTKAKVQLVGALLLVMLVWPVAHHHLAGRVGFDPWKFFGWSMYTVPHRLYHAAVHVTDGETRMRQSELSGAVATAYRRFIHLHEAYGLHANPTQLIAALRRQRPSADRIDIRVHAYGLDRRSRKIVLQGCVDHVFQQRTLRTMDCGDL